MLFEPFHCTQFGWVLLPVTRFGKFIAHDTFAVGGSEFGILFHLGIVSSQCSGNAFGLNEVEVGVVSFALGTHWAEVDHM